MLQIKNISKKYVTGDLTQIALNDVSLNFRENEFVSILGPSGSGKTTLLNIIGGLDKYDSGDLIINNISTKNYKDRDWDSYRNHTIGFVFQSYNLIPHQSVLSNVELALTISGISKAERKKRALDALEQVGLKEQAHKKPNQMSGGQMQRVAIARALVNNPDILLADEPTGALDTTTSVQVMELLKKVAQDRLVIMVTHNPELAEQYSTRIVKLRDGKIVDDSDPFILDPSTVEDAKHKNLGKSSMSLPTAFSLSLNNLLTKKARTILTSFAGSIGIIGIALILSLSTGFQNYINQIQEETLTSYPLTLTSETADMTSALLSIASEAGESGKEGTVKEIQSISTMFSKVGSNDLASFKKYLEENQDFVDEHVSVVQYSYNVNPLIYTKNESGITQVNPNTLVSSISGTSGIVSSMQSSGSSIFNEMLDDRDTLISQYDVIAGKWPEKYNEMILVLNNKSSINELLVYSLGLRDSAELTSMLSKVMSDKAIDKVNEPLEFTYEELLNLEYKLIDASDTYKYNAKYDIYEDMSDDEAYMENVYNNAENLKIVGIVVPKEGSTSMTLTTGVAYTKELTQHVIDKASKSEIVLKQLANDEINVFSGKRFDEETSEAGLDFQDMISVDTTALSSAFGVSVSQNDIANMTQNYMGEIAMAIDADTSEAESMVNDTLNVLLNDMLTKYMEDNKTVLSLIESSENIDVSASLTEILLYIQTNYPEINVDEETLKNVLEQLQDNISLPSSGMEGAYITQESFSAYVSEYMQSEYAQSKMAELSSSYILPQESFTMMFSGFLNGYYETLNQFVSSEDGKLFITSDLIEPSTQLYTGVLSLSGATGEIAEMMSETIMRTTILSKVGELMGQLTSTMASAMNVDPSAIASAFTFNLSEEELTRLMTTMSSSGMESNAANNLSTLGYQDMEDPYMISFYFKDFDSKETFKTFLDDYNTQMEKVDDDKVIKYTDLTGILMSSMSVIVDSVSYVLIAFVSISLVVSSIMIGIITYISVLERTKEIGVLRAIGASKKNISSIFNAETFIVGLFAGIIGIGVTLALVPPINWIIHTVTGNMAINATLPFVAAIILIVLSVILTLIGGIIPSKKAAKQDPVTALRSE